MVKSTLAILFCVLIAQGIKAQRSDCDTILPAFEAATTHFNGSNVVYSVNNYTICLKDTNYYQLRFENLSGASGMPVEIVLLADTCSVNSEANYYGIKFLNCRNVKLSGRKANNLNQIGLSVSNVKGLGITVDKLSSDFEIEYVKIENVKLAGIMVKTDPDCSFNSTRDSFLLKNVIIHNNLIRKTGMEGMYIGNTFYNGYTLNCNGVDTVVFPHLLENVQIYDNIIDSTAWDGIQVSSSNSPCAVCNNTITNDSYAEYYGQMSGLNLGNGSQCDCYNNKVFSGFGNGIEVHSRGNIKVFNNLLVRPGLRHKPNQQGSYSKAGIYVSYNLTNPGNLPYSFINNTIIDTKSDGIRFANKNSADNIFYNNIIVNPGSYDHFVFYNDDPMKSYIHFDAVVTRTESNNIKTRNRLDVDFVNAENDNFQILPTSIAYNSGINVGFAGIDFDIENSPRPMHGQYDIGAYECTEGAGIESICANSGLKIHSLKCVNTSLIVEFSIRNKDVLSFSLYNLSGMNILQFKPLLFLPGQHSLTLANSFHCTNSIVILKITTKHGSFSHKFYYHE